jgi:deoxyhypusine synthase
MALQPVPTGPVEDLHVRADMTVGEVLEGFGRMGGFTPPRLVEAVRVLRRMRSEDATVVMSIPAAPIATGLRGVVTDLVRLGFVDAIVTTCGTLDHDLARTWGAYHHGAFEMNDAELHAKDVHRLGNVLVPAASYGALLEDRLRPLLASMFAERAAWPTTDFCRRLGDHLDADENRESSLLWTAKEKNVPIFVPGPLDGAVGSQVWMAYQQNRRVAFDLLADEQALSDLVATDGKLGGLVLGGGISKHHLIWWAQFHDGLDYAVAVTTASEYDGSLSGARLREAISWGKLKEAADHVTVDGDMTLVLPLLAAGWTAP